MHKLLRLLGTIISVAFIATGVLAVEYDLRKDWDFPNNPNGEWSFGYSTSITPGPSLQMTRFQETLGGGPATVEWYRQTPELLDPNVRLNRTKDKVYSVAPDAIAFHPGPKGELSIIRFTSPGPLGSLMITGYADAVDGGTVDFWLIKNSELANQTVLFSKLGLTRGFRTTFGLRTELNQGETLDLVVGSSGSYLFDSTEVGLTVQSVPEPASAAVIAAAIAAFRLSRFKRT